MHVHLLVFYLNYKMHGATIQKKHGTTHTLHLGAFLQTMNAINQSNTNTKAYHHHHHHHDAILLFKKCQIRQKKKSPVNQFKILG
jgi:hypothetical protein